MTDLSRERLCAAIAARKAAEAEIAAAASDLNAAKSARNRPCAELARPPPPPSQASAGMRLAALAAQAEDLHKTLEAATNGRFVLDSLAEIRAFSGAGRLQVSLTAEQEHALAGTRPLEAATAAATAARQAAHYGVWRNYFARLLDDADASPPGA